MIKAHLESQFKIDRLYNSWLIQSNDTLESLTELKDFITSNLLGKSIPLDIHPDFKIIEKIKYGIGSKNINVVQIRLLQEFLNKTYVISNYKVGVIYQAELMNLNAANSCLKILEDTPKNSYIFLIVSNARNVLATIRSRCAKINTISTNQVLKEESYQKFIAVLLIANIELQLNFLKEHLDKNRELWFDFSNAIRNLMKKIIKKAIGIEVSFNELEVKIVKQFKSNSLEYLVEKFEKINELIDNTVNYDLDLKASSVLLINLFRS